MHAYVSQVPVHTYASYVCVVCVLTYFPSQFRPLRDTPEAMGTLGIQTSASSSIFLGREPRLPRERAGSSARSGKAQDERGMFVTSENKN